MTTNWQMISRLNSKDLSIFSRSKNGLFTTQRKIENDFGQNKTFSILEPQRTTLENFNLF